MASSRSKVWGGIEREGSRFLAALEMTEGQQIKRASPSRSGFQRNAMKKGHHVVIIGGGFGGLYATQSLKRAPVRVTLVDQRNFHLFQPLLYQVATGWL